MNGTIDDGWDGVLGWFWVASAVVTGVLAFTTRAALREKSYSAVMAATGTAAASSHDKRAGMGAACSIG